MAHPRFALVIGGSRSAAPVSTWPYGDRVVGGAAANGSWFAWRLLGGNNRELGRSAQVHPSPAACRDAAVEVRNRIAALTSVLATDARQGQWRWRLDDADAAVAVSSRLYLRQRECTYNLAQFIAGAPIAELWGGDGDDGEPMPADGFGKFEQFRFVEDGPGLVAVGPDLVDRKERNDVLPGARGRRGVREERIETSAKRFMHGMDLLE